MAPRGRTRVLLIAPALRITGGQAVQASRLMRELSADPSVRIDFLPIAPAFRGPFRVLQSIRYVRTVLTFLAYLPLIAWKVPRYDILHIFSASYWSYALWSMTPMLLGRMLGKKTILNYRSGEAEDHLTRWRTAAPTIRLADVVVSPSEYLIDVFARFGVQAQSIYNVIDAGNFRYRERGRLRPVFLHNRGLEPLYNVQCTIRAFEIVQRRYPEASLTIAHEGSCRPALEQLVRDLGLRNVTFIGSVPQNRMPDLYDSADIYLMSPDLDCMPGSVLECYASGIPLVATKAGGIPYMVKDGETGVLVDLNDHEAMAKCAIRLLEDDALASRIAEAGRRELEKYRGPAIRQAWVELYGQLARRNS